MAFQVLSRGQAAGVVRPLEFGEQSSLAESSGDNGTQTAYVGC